ncbi:MAG: glucose-1-phosphate adenylyltransferase [Zetaproteobacteria bacterium CG12_big_fil_rev_8_21_14_0_65_54_13]|nr:MAG: glucose-1-phosphate adenylyltransferase [Zetaproteobacteria bacterium CG12_big_fil_rev_8_21_14_0_65_54_13]PIX54063.1 MAG: glucose-1-phosphate adenylyltransferase [Zetaproteobacteria bacterium CG_4_10_14_3_um_filter_54_28]PJA28901.1 MAG: glucose-1-phosphate adenylyltransferase [Zetaproteobacteria bacterium CG_4_9_14_3_um_filter_54_145]
MAPQIEDSMGPQMERNISRLTANTVALVLAGGRGSRLKDLTNWRAKPAVPFGGKFRIIDFPMSNCINSGIRRISVLTQYKSHSLQRHLQRGWSFMSGQFGEFVEVLPAQQRKGEGWYAGTADAVYQNLDIIRHYNPDYVVILAGDHIYKMDYGKMIAAHVAKGADITVGCIPVPLAEARAFGVMSIDKDSRIVEFAEKPANPKPVPGDESQALASMGIYVFSKQYLRDRLVADAADESSTHDFGHDLIPHAIEHANAFAFPFMAGNTSASGYWRDVGTIDAYWEANINLCDIAPELNLYDKNWPIWTYQEQLPPAKFAFNDDERRGHAIDSLISGGCLVTGATIRHSLLFSSVRVHSHTVVEDSVILPDVEIRHNCRIRRCVIDKGTIIPEGTVIGEDPIEDAKRFDVSAGGIVLVTPEMMGQNVHEA